MDGQTTEVIDSFFPLKTDVPNRGWSACYRSLFATYLINMGESSLYTSKTASANVFRFFALEKPSSVVTVYIDNDNAFAVCKRIDRIKENGRVFTFAEQRLGLTKHDRKLLLANIELAGFWSLSIDGEPPGLDGFRYVVEAKAGDRYHAVDRWCPTKGKFAKLCQTFLRIHDRAWNLQSKTRWWSRLLPIGKQPSTTHPSTRSGLFSMDNPSRVPR